MATSIGSIHDLVKSTAEWCSENGCLEPPGLDLQPPDVRHLVETVELFDYLSELTGISVEQIGEWFNDAEW